METFLLEMPTSPGAQVVDQPEPPGMLAGHAATKRIAFSGAIVVTAGLLMVFAQLHHRMTVEVAGRREAAAVALQHALSAAARFAARGGGPAGAT